MTYPDMYVLRTKQNTTCHDSELFLRVGKRWSFKKVKMVCIIANSSFGVVQKYAGMWATLQIFRK